MFFIKINTAPWPLSSTQKKNDRTNLVYDGWRRLYVASSNGADDKELSGLPIKESFSYSVMD